jgi:hypothetical protein
LYTGTISESFGIYKAIDLAIELHKLDSRFHLTIIGYCADAMVYQKFKAITNIHYFINVVGGNVPVPHYLVIEEIKKGGLGLVTYQRNKAINNKMPTKLYEYIYNQLPMLIPHDQPWIGFTSQFMASIVVNYTDMDPFYLYQTILQYDFYFSYNQNQVNKSILWDPYILLDNIY